MGYWKFFINNQIPGFLHYSCFFLTGMTLKWQYEIPKQKNKQKYCWIVLICVHYGESALWIVRPMKKVAGLISFYKSLCNVI